MFRTNSKRMGCSTRRPAGLAPLRLLSRHAAAGCLRLQAVSRASTCLRNKRSSSLLRLSNAARKTDIGT